MWRRIHCNWRNISCCSLWLHMFNICRFWAVWFLWLSDHSPLPLLPWNYKTATYFTGTVIFLRMKGLGNKLISFQAYVFNSKIKPNFHEQVMFVTNFRLKDTKRDKLISFSELCTEIFRLGYPIPICVSSDLKSNIWQTCSKQLCYLLSSCLHETGSRSVSWIGCKSPLATIAV
jgi:hypothetical protein